MEIVESGSQQSRRASSEWFTGTVWQDVISRPREATRASVLMVRFEPGSRTVWHTHPLGQTLHIVSGTGLVQVWGQPIRQMHTGDVIYIAPGENHWHGAAPNSFLTQLAIQENVNGSAVDWGQPVTDGQYSGAA